MALVSLSNGPAFPAEIISQFILHLEDDRDLQASSEVGIDWVSGARRGFFGSVMKLPSLGRVRGLAELLSSPLCTLRIQHRPTSLIMSLPDDEEVYHRDTARMMDTLVFPFLRDFVRIRLGATVTFPIGTSLVTPSPSPFRWEVLSNWASLNNLTIGGIFPSMSVLVPIIDTLPELTAVEFNCICLESTIPSIRPSTKMAHLKSLIIGPMGGIEVLSCLAMSTNLDVGGLTLEVRARSSLSPLSQFIHAYGEKVSSLAISIHSPARLREVDGCLSQMDNLEQFHINFRYVDTLSYWYFITAMCPTLTTALLRTFTLRFPYIRTGWPLHININTRDQAAAIQILIWGGLQQTPANLGLRDIDVVISQP